MATRIAPLKLVTVLPAESRAVTWTGGLIVLSGMVPRGWTVNASEVGGPGGGPPPPALPPPPPPPPLPPPGEFTSRSRWQLAARTTTARRWNGRNGLITRRRVQTAHRPGRPRVGLTVGGGVIYGDERRQHLCRVICGFASPR